MDERGLGAVADLLDPGVDKEVHEGVLWVTKPVVGGSALAHLCLEVLGGGHVTEQLEAAKVVTAAWSGGRSLTILIPDVKHSNLLISLDSLSKLEHLIRSEILEAIVCLHVVEDLPRDFPLSIRFFDVIVVNLEVQGHHEFLIDLNQGE